MDLKGLLASYRPVIADGGWGTQFAARGLRASVPELLNVSEPEAVAAVAADYVAAGAQIILTNTFGGSPVKLAKAGVGDHGELNRLGVELSKRGAAGKALVFASIGPTGELVGLTSALSEGDLRATFAEQVTALLAGGPDGFVIETMADLTEAKAALHAVKSCADLPVVSCMAFDEGARGPATMMGITPERAARELEEAGADLVGANCGRLSDGAWERVVGILAEATDLPIWAKPNAGVPQLVAGKSVFDMDPTRFARLGRRLAEAGARVVGGCCGTTPEHIAALVEAAR